MKATINKMEDLGINFFGLSANKSEHLMKKYFGEMWAMVSLAADSYLNKGKVLPKEEIEKWPIIGGLVTSEAKDMRVDEFFKASKEINEVASSAQKAESTVDVDRFKEIIHDPENKKALDINPELLNLKEAFGRNRTGIEEIKKNPGGRYDREEMTRRIKVLEEQNRKIAILGMKEIRQMGLDY